MFLIILLKSIIIGGLVGVGVGAGAARMFHAPTVQGMGAFRTLGELNSCEGDPASHFSFGLGSSPFSTQRLLPYLKRCKLPQLKYWCLRQTCW